MFCKGEYRNDRKAYGVICSHTKRTFEAMLINNGIVESAYKKDDTGEYAFGNVVAKEMATTLLVGIRGCTSKNGNAMAFELGVLTQHEFIKTRVDYLIQLSAGELCGCDISGENQHIELLYDKNITFPSDIEYIKLTTSSKKDISVADGDDVIVRSVNEIALEKEDITWLKNKKYYIVNDDEKAEQIFSYLDNYDGVIAYDTETTGLRINCFGKINSSYQRELEKYNKEHPNEQLRADKLVGIIYCIEPNVSYYFPCGNRKFKNLYDDKESHIRKKLIEQIKAKYTVGELRDSDGDMADYVRKTAPEDFTSDVILMERNRHILTTKHIVPHGGSFEWKVGWLYEIDTNIKDDTMLLHQIMYKFRSTTRNSGEPSNLKYLAKVELGVDQWELNDFFPDFKEDDGGEIRVKAGSRKKKQNSKIDFSYMDYDGTRVYAPTDGDVTFQLLLKYKKDMVENHPEQIYIYNVEVLVECAIGYMEFYGHRINEDKILGVRDRTKAKIVKIESEIRQIANYSSAKELEKYNELVKLLNDSENDPDNKELLNSILKATEELRNIIDNDSEHPLNLASPAQVADLFYVKMGIPFKSGEKMSVAKGQLKGLLKERNEDGTPKYPIVHLYSEYKKEDTLVTKFFDNLPYFMYPGGVIFSHYGQISTATGRMSCNKPNAQQYPKAITGIVEPRDGYVMMDADYSQIEYRVLVAMSNNNKLAELFSDPDSDYHTLMASQMYGVPYASVTPKMRGDAKSFNFGIPYGMGLGSLAILLTGVNNQRTRDEAAEKYELYFKDQPMTRKFFDQVKEMAQVKRYTKTFWNRYRYYSFTDADGNENNAKKAAALRQAGNAVIQGTAADIFKISVARNFMYIRENNLLGDLLIVNMVHDEQLMEVNVKKLNMQRVLRDVGINMQFKINGFPPLYIGAGIGPAWGKAKGKMAEIHPNLLEQLSREADVIPLRHSENESVEPKDVLKYFEERVLGFRRQKVIDYITNPDNFHQTIHPAIGGLINLQFNYGRGGEAKAYMGGKYTDEEFLLLNLSDFIAENNLDIKAEWFKAMEAAVDEEEDDEYDEREDGELDEIEEEKSFSLVDESNKFYGSSLQDIISIFGTCVLDGMNVCGVDMRNIYYKKKDAIIDYLATKVCDESDSDALEIVYLLDGNVLNHTGVYVKGLNASKLEGIFKANNNTLT
ncbi:MAG: hypothetical protein J6A59_14160 [Lachnospiraceae bacterium]|nr:hypothetical protein [Lachnospiraceae bacterium]